ncbi:hypothetical protein C8J57DRAFT_1704724 [Mycena rebaudengoi]|nr:hypothetical protein C8J57DRAFT_1704724 [Mycena rebaudengoi]
MPGAFGLSAAPTTAPANKFDFVFGSGGATPAKGNDGANRNGTNGGANNANGVNDGPAAEQTKAEILAELDQVD